MCADRRCHAHSPQSAHPSMPPRAFHAIGGQSEDQQVSQPFADAPNAICHSAMPRSGPDAIDLTARLQRLFPTPQLALTKVSELLSKEFLSYTIHLEDGNLIKARTAFRAADKVSNTQNTIVRIRLTHAKHPSRMDASSLYCTRNAFGNSLAGGLPSLECLLLPAEQQSTQLVWPTFFDPQDSKHGYALGKRLLFRSLSDPSQRVLGYLGSRLFDGIGPSAAIAVVGARGTGKTCQLQHILIEGISRLHQMKEALLLYRIGAQLLAFWCDPMTHAVHAHSCVCESTHDLQRILDSIFASGAGGNKGPVLLLDLRDGETVPSLPIHRMVVTLPCDSSAVGHSNLEIVRAQPWGYDELELACTALEFSGCKNIIQQFKDRSSDVTAFKHLLSNEALFAEVQQAIQCAPEVLFASLAEVSLPCGIPEHASLFVSPVLREDALTQQMSALLSEDNWRLSFATPYLCALVTSQVTSFEHLKLIKQLGLHDQVQKMQVLLGGFLTRNPWAIKLKDRQRWNNWVWMQDGVSLTLNQIKSVVLAGMPKTNTVLAITGEKTMRPVHELNSTVVYANKNAEDGVVFDFLTVNHETKVVFMVLVSAKYAKDNALSETALRSALKHLDMLRGDNEYRIVFINANPMNLPFYNDCTVGLQEHGKELFVRINEEAAGGSVVKWADFVKGCADPVLQGVLSKAQAYFVKFRDTDGVR